MCIRFFALLSKTFSMLELGWLNVGLELRSGLLPTVWESPVKVVLKFKLTTFRYISEGTFNYKHIKFVSTLIFTLKNRKWFYPKLV